MNYNDAINIPTTAIRMVKASGSRNCPCVRHPHDISKCNTKKKATIGNRAVQKTISTSVIANSARNPTWWKPRPLLCLRRHWRACVRKYMPEMLVVPENRRAKKQRKREIALTEWFVIYRFCIDSQGQLNTSAYNKSWEFMWQYLNRINSIFMGLSPLLGAIFLYLGQQQSKKAASRIRIYFIEFRFNGRHSTLSRQSCDWETFGLVVLAAIRQSGALLQLPVRVVRVLSFSWACVCVVPVGSLPLTRCCRLFSCFIFVGAVIFSCFLSLSLCRCQGLNYLSLLEGILDNFLAIKTLCVWIKIYISNMYTLHEAGSATISQMVYCDCDTHLNATFGRGRFLNGFLLWSNVDMQNERSIVVCDARCLLLHRKFTIK